MTKIRGRVTMIAEVLSPLRHGDGVVGNVQTFRRRRIYVKGQPEDVPYVSGNSMKHWLRENGALFAIQAAGIDHDLDREHVQLLFGGGKLTAGGQSAKLEEARRLSELLPVLSLHGYSCSGMMTSSQMRVDHLTLACHECDTQTRAALNRYAPHKLNVLDRRGESYVESEFGTRQVPERRAHIFDALSDQAQGEAIKSLELGEKSDQMIYEYEVLAVGSVLVGGVTFPHGITELELQAFRSAITYGSEGRTDDGRLLMRFGGSTATGYGLCAVSLHGELAEGIEAWRSHDTDALSPARGEGEDYDEALSAYAQHLHENAEHLQKAMEAMI